jgi:hypothetical protein
MSIFTLPDTDVPVTLVNDLSEEELLEFPAFKVRFIPKITPSLIELTSYRNGFKLCN